MNSTLPPTLIERVLSKLGFSAQPEPTLENLRRIYASWCQRVPFDNVRKLIHARSGSTAPFPGNTAEDFLEAWLKHGTGGTCWAGAGAFQALLLSFSFTAVRGIGTMLVAPDLPPNHGTVRVTFGPEEYLVDCSVLHGEPLRLAEHEDTEVKHPAWGVRCIRRAGKSHIVWRPLHKLDGFECRLESFGATREDYANYYEKTRGWSPFNYELSVRLNQDDRVIGAAFGKAVSLETDGTTRERRIQQSERARLLIEDIGLSEEIVSQLPADVPTPPPPGSKTAKAAED